MLDIEHLKTFVAIAELKSFSKAAKQLHLTQSTVSQRIMRLEEELDAELIDRTTRATELTVSGKKLLMYARQILALAQEAREVIKNDIRGKVIHIGAPENVISQTLLASFSVFYDRYPGTRFEITTGLSEELRAMYESGQLDMVVVRQKEGEGGVTLRQEPLVWIDSREKPAVHRNPLPLVLFPDRGLYREDIFHTLNRLQRPWRIALVSPVLSGILSAVAHGIGVSIVPKGALLNTHVVLDEQHGFAVSTMELALYHRSDMEREAHFLIESIAKLDCSKV